MANAETITWGDRVDSVTPAGTSNEAAATHFNTMKSAINDHASKIDALETATNTATGRLGKYVNTATTTVTNTTAETTLIPSGSGSLVIPADSAAAGTVVRGAVYVDFSTPAGSPTLTVKIKFGSTVVGSVTTSALPASATNNRLKIDFQLVFTSIGASGVVRCGGDVNYEGSSARVFDDLSKTSTTIDTTADQTLDITGTWDAASTSRTLTVENLLIERIN